MVSHLYGKIWIEFEGKEANKTRNNLGESQRIMERRAEQVKLGDMHRKDRG